MLKQNEAIGNKIGWCRMQNIKNILVPDGTNRQVVAPFDIVIKGFGEHNMHSTIINFLARNGNS
jgi:hypothetical protein